MVFAAQEKEVQRLRLVPLCGELQQDQQGKEEIRMKGCSREQPFKIVIFESIKQYHYLFDNRQLPF